MVKLYQLMAVYVLLFGSESRGDGVAVLINDSLYIAVRK